MKLNTKTSAALIATCLVAFSGSAMAEQEKRSRGGLLMEADTNGDGMISQEEYLAQATARFNKLDADGDGQVTKEEIKARHQARRDEMKERFKERGNRRGGKGGKGGRRKRDRGE